jgi:hypothetical protein
MSGYYVQFGLSCQLLGVGTAPTTRGMLTSKCTTGSKGRRFHRPNFAPAEVSFTCSGSAPKGGGARPHLRKRHSMVR